MPCNTVLWAVKFDVVTDTLQCVFDSFERLVGESVQVKHDGIPHVPAKLLGFRSFGFYSLGEIISGLESVELGQILRVDTIEVLLEVILILLASERQLH